MGRGTMPTLIPEKTAQVNQAREESKTSVTDKAVTTTKVSTTTTTSSTLAETTTTFGFYKKLPENVAETLPPLPPPTTNKPVENKNKQPTKSYVSKRKPEESKEKAPEPKKEPKAKKPEPPAQKAEPADPQFSLQVAALATMDDAKAEAARVARKTRHKVRVVVSEVKGKTWYRIRVGGFSTKAEAHAAAQELRASGLKPMLVRFGG